MIMVRLKKGESVERGLKRLKKILRKGSSQIRACSHPRPFPFRDGSDVSLPPNGKRAPTARSGLFIFFSAFVHQFTIWTILLGILRPN